jgi:tRNA splicing endonuclease
MHKFIFLLLIITTTVVAFSNIQITLNNVSLKESLKILEEVSGSTILTAPDIKGTINTTINVLNVENALDSLLYSTIYEYKKINEDIYIVGNFNIKMQNMQKEISQIEFNHLDLKKIPNLLTLLSEKVFVINSSNIILLNKNDEMYESIKELFEFLEKQHKENRYLLFFSISEISDDVHQFLKENEKVEPEDGFFIKNKKSTIILENNLQSLAKIKEIGYFEFNLPHTQKRIFYNLPTIDNIALDISNNSVIIKNQTKKENNSIILNEGEIGYLATENRGKNYLVSITYLDLENLYIKRNYENGENFESRFNFGIGYLFPDTGLILLSGLKLGNNYIEISSNFKEHFDFSFTINLINNMNLGVLFKNSPKESNTHIFINDLQQYENFDLYGNFILGGTINLSSSLTNNIDFISYDLLILKEIIQNKNNPHNFMFAPGAGIKISKSDKLKPYFNFGVQYVYEMHRSKINLTYYYQMNIHKLTCSLEF